LTYNAAVVLEGRTVMLRPMTHLGPLAPALVALALLVRPAPAIADQPAARDVAIAASDGATLKGTYYPAAKSGPAVLLLHMCNTTRGSWEPLGRQLSAAGIHALAYDYRGFGESAGPRFDTQTPADRLKMVTGQWPGDADAALAYLLSQSGVDKTRVGVAGGSCGVNQALQTARRHPAVRSLVLLAGPADRAGRDLLRRSPWLPVFAAAADDDQYDFDAPQMMQWIADFSGNPRSTSVRFADGKHGTEIFGPHPELVRQIVAFSVDTLITLPADPKANVVPRKTASAELWSLIDDPAGVTKAVAFFRETRSRDPKAFLFPEPVMNVAGYERLQAGQAKDAIELFKLNVEAFPASANAYDSLGDAYLADGQRDLALTASRRALELLPADRNDERQKEAIRASAQEKIDKLAASSVK
jgi:dienelactone hydrolase